MSDNLFTKDCNNSNVILENSIKNIDKMNNSHGKLLPKAFSNQKKASETDFPKINYKFNTPDANNIKKVKFDTHVAGNNLSQNFNISDGKDNLKNLSILHQSLKKRYYKHSVISTSRKKMKDVFASLDDDSFKDKSFFDRSLFLNNDNPEPSFTLLKHFNNNINLINSQEKEIEFGTVENTITESSTNTIKQNMSNNNLKMTLSRNHKFLKNKNKSVIYVKSTGYVKGFAAHSMSLEGYSNFNRLCLIPNVKPTFKMSKKEAINISYFAIYDGEKSEYFCEKLKEYLYKYIFLDEKFLIQTEIAIKNAFQKIQQNLKENDIRDCSNFSIAICLIIRNICYIINFGQTKNIMSFNNSEDIFMMNRIHKFDSKERIKFYSNFENENKNSLVAPIFKFYDQSDFSPETLSFYLTKEIDFIFMISKNISEKLTNNQIICLIYESCLEVTENFGYFSMSKIYSISMSKIFQTVQDEGAQENMSFIILFFENFIDFINSKNVTEIKKRIASIYKEDYNRYFDRIDLIISKPPNEIKMTKIIIENNEKSETPEIKENKNQENNDKYTKVIINKVNNNINITKTRIYLCCCFKKRSFKKTTNSYENYVFNK